MPVKPEVFTYEPSVSLTAIYAAPFLYAFADTWANPAMSSQRQSRVLTIARTSSPARPTNIPLLIALTVEIAASPATTHQTARAAADGYARAEPSATAATTADPSAIETTCTLFRYAVPIGAGASSAKAPISNGPATAYAPGSGSSSYGASASCSISWRPCSFSRPRSTAASVLFKTISKLASLVST